jgi:hypothetical protein
MDLVRIRSVAPLAGFKLRLGLTDGRTIERDVGPLLGGPAFAAVREDRSVFEAVRVEGGTLVWPNDVDLCPDAVIWKGKPPWASEMATATRGDAARRSTTRSIGRRGANKPRRSSSSKGRAGK